MTLHINYIHCKAKLAIEPTFMDYLFNDFQLTLSCGVDFTISNSIAPHGHHSQSNGYRRCLMAVSEVVTWYNSEQMADLYGFSGCVDGKRSHCFGLGGGGDGRVRGVEGVLEAYDKAVNSVDLSAPTIYGEVLRRAIWECRVMNGIGSRAAGLGEDGDLDVLGEVEWKKFMVKVLLVDGTMSDLVETCDAIVEASFLPMSIVIVGIDIPKDEEREIQALMEPLTHSRKEISLNRPTVQYISYEECEGRMDKLREKIFQFVPQQMTTYYRKARILPEFPAALLVGAMLVSQSDGRGDPGDVFNLVADIAQEIDVGPEIVETIVDLHVPVPTVANISPSF
eukprot:CAMPEP_0115040088 /NCGR_PEP_ID=MMETSP0216-20121206/44573_1 /TAXON_ID=223996 /ORGANISM="Protocruzia adherens, Strain Boccale" /LENGTH=337 /DNA_ID=CAMNT_0002421167 /DNA_START=935 /DNA_END=1949 /DNA_ORIENTATION=+